MSIDVWTPLTLKCIHTEIYFHLKGMLSEPTLACSNPQRYNSEQTLLCGQKIDTAVQYFNFGLSVIQYFITVYLHMNKS